MKNRRLNLILVIIAAVAILPVLVFVTSGSFDNSLSSNNPANDAQNDHVLFPSASGSESPVDVGHVFKAKVRGGDAVGNVATFKVIDNFIDTENNCEFCTRIDYTPGHQGVAGFSYLDKNGFDLTHAKRVTFFVAEISGNATVKVMVGGTTSLTGSTGPEIFSGIKFAKTTKYIHLGKDWKKFEIDVSKSDLKNITNPFALEIKNGKSSGKIILYLKYVVYDTQLAKNAAWTEKNLIAP